MNKIVTVKFRVHDVETEDEAYGKIAGLMTDYKRAGPHVDTEIIGARCEEDDS